MNIDSVSILILTVRRPAIKNCVTAFREFSVNIIGRGAAEEKSCAESLSICSGDNCHIEALFVGFPHFDLPTSVAEGTHQILNAVIGQNCLSQKRAVISRHFWNKPPLLVIALLFEQVELVLRLASK